MVAVVAAAFAAANIHYDEYPWPSQGLHCPTRLRASTPASARLSPAPCFFFPGAARALSFAQDDRLDDEYVRSAKCLLQTLTMPNSAPCLCFRGAPKSLIACVKALQVRLQTLQVRLKTLRVRLQTLQVRLKILRVRIQSLQVRLQTLRERSKTLRVALKSPNLTCESMAPVIFSLLAHLTENRKESS